MFCAAGACAGERMGSMDILESLVDSSSHAIFTLDADGIVTHINSLAK